MVQQPGLEFTSDLFERLRELAESAYPNEGCGILVGSQGAERCRVSEVLEGRNLVTERSRDRYELDPRDIIAAERSARARSEEVLGFYHTHPDHPARPSQFDTDHAWPGYHYLVIAVQGGRQVAASAWRLRSGAPPPQFEEAPLQVAGADGRGYNPPGLVAKTT